MNLKSQNRSRMSTEIFPPLIMSSATSVTRLYLFIHEPHEFISSSLLSFRPWTEVQNFSDLLTRPAAARCVNMGGLLRLHISQRETRTTCRLKWGSFREGTQLLHYNNSTNNFAIQKSPHLSGPNVSVEMSSNGTDVFYT